MPDPLIKLEKSEARWDLTLNRPPLNILTRDLMRELITVLGEVERERKVKVLVVWGGEKAWSAGADVKEHLPEEYEEMLDLFAHLCQKVKHLPQITIAAVDGSCLGGGCELAAMHDFIIATDRARFGQPEIKVGVFPPVGCADYPLRMGWSSSLYILASGEILSAEEAQRLRLVFKVVPSDSLKAEVDRFSSLFLGLSGEVLRLTKKAALRSLDLSPGLALEEAIKIYQKELMVTYDALEGLEAFIQKRSPQWKDS